MSIEGIGSYEEIYGNTLSKEDMTNLDTLGVEWRGRNIYDIQDDFHLKIVELAHRALENTAQTNPGALLKIKADIVELFQTVFTEEDDEDEISSLLYHYDPISGTYQELIAAQGKLKDTIKKTGKALKKAGKKTGKVCAKVVKSDIKARKKAVKDIVKVKGKIEKPILKVEAKVNDWVEEHPVQAAVIGAAIVVTVVTAGLASSAIAGAVEAAVGSAETIGSSVGAAAGTGAAAAGAAATAAANNRSKSDQDNEEKPKSSPSSSTPSQNTPPSVNSGISSQPVNSITSDSAIANPSVPQPLNPNFKPVHEERFIEKAVGTAKYILAKETHEAREILGDLRVGAAALGNEVADILNPILPKDAALPKKNLADIQKDTFVAHQHLDEFFEIPLSNKYDPDPLIEKRELVTGTIPLPGISVLTQSGKAGKIAKAVETAGALSDGVIAEEAALAGRQIVTIEKGGTSLQKTVGNTFGTVVGEKAALDSLEKFKRAEAYLRPHSGKYLLEVEAKELIHQAGIRTFPRPNGIPENFKVKLSGGGAGIKYIHQENPHISVRVMPGKPHSPNPYQQKPYVIQMKDGKAIDKLGKSVDKKSPEAHIPLEEFIYRNN